MSRAAGVGRVEEEACRMVDGEEGCGTRAVGGHKLGDRKTWSK